MTSSAHEVRLDHARSTRIGIEEAILCAGKTAGQLSHILDDLATKGRTALLTRLDETQVAAFDPGHRAAMDYDPTSRTAFFGAVAAPAGPARVAIVTAGSSDARIGREAARTLAYSGHASDLIFDVGVAGLWRLLEQVERLEGMDVVIAVAGMDAALISVLGGLVPGVLIAVPTSTGYGVANGGETALHAALVSCSPGVLTVNIDNGYGAGCAAMRVLGLSAAEAALQDVSTGT